MRHRLEADPNATYTRAEARLVHRTRIDLRTGIPFICFFGVPIIGNLAPLIAIFLPRFLPSTLWTPEQIVRHNHTLAIHSFIRSLIGATYTARYLIIMLG